MELKSLALRTNLIHNNFEGEIFDRGEYLVIKTDSRPNYFWGNYLIFQYPPVSSDFHTWLVLFEKEIGLIAERGFVSITWDSSNGENGEIQPFIDYGFSVQKSSILVADSVHLPPKYNKDIIIRPIDLDADWESYTDIHFQPDWEYGSDQQQRSFLQKECESLREMVDRNLGMRFIAEQNGKLVGDAGIYWDNKVGRFNNVGTHRDFQRQGVCSTLIYEASQYVFETKKIKTLVMEANEDYHAAQIYNSIGFKEKEKLVMLQWYDKSKF